jgi:hypothetical protein
MSVKSRTARGSVEGNESLWRVDFTDVLLFLDDIGHM